MKFSLMRSCIYSLIIFCNCVLSKRKKIKDGEILKYNKRSGIYISNDMDIQKYEHEHQMMYRNEDGTVDEAKYMQWHSKLATKHTTEFCRKYLKYVVPRRGITGVYAKLYEVKVSYIQKEGPGRNVAAIKCVLPLTELRLYRVTYHITEAPQHCVYAIMRNRTNKGLFRIVSKVCDFEDDSSPDFKFTRNNLKNETGGIHKTHRSRGIPIACDDLIEEYEYQHQQMHKNKDGNIDEDKYYIWPEYTEKNYLISLCSQYLKAIVPGRARDINYGIVVQVLKRNINYCLKNKGLKRFVSVIQCQLPPFENRRNQISYYITEAPDKNCVFALVRNGKKLGLKIVFRICGFIADKGSPKNDVDMVNGIESNCIKIPQAKAQEE